MKRFGLFSPQGLKRPLRFRTLERWLSFNVQEILVLGVTVRVDHFSKQVEVDSHVF